MKAKWYWNLSPEEKASRLLKCVFALALVLGISMIALIIMVSSLSGKVSAEGNAVPVFSEQYSDEIESTYEEPTYQECSILANANKYMNDYVSNLEDTYDEEYFESEFHTTFVNGFWYGFWDQHKHCKTCKANGDVPAEYVD